MKRRFGARLILASVIAGNWVGCSALPESGEADVWPHYSLRARVLPVEGRLEISGTIILPAVDTSRAEIALSLTERMREFRAEVVEPHSHAGSMPLQRGSEDRGSVKWLLRPFTPFPAGQRIVLQFSAVGDGGIATMYYVGPEVAFASAWGTDWYPLQEGQDKGTGDLTVTVPAGWSVATGGVRGGTDGEEAAGRFRSTISQPTYLSFAAGPYAVVHRGGDVPLAAYLLAPRERIPSYLEGVASMMDVLTDEFGAFPFGTLSLVEVPRDLSNAAGFNAFSAAGMLVLNSRAFDAPDPKYLHEWLSHEVGHQWFPNVVALRTPPGRYMEEALAQYGGLRVVETLDGPEAAQQFRRTGFVYDPIYSALAYFQSVGAGIDQPLRDLQPGLEHRNLAYTKGALVFDMLSREIGRKAFQRILNDIVQDFQFRGLTWEEFLAAIERGAGRDLSWFYQQWFERPGAPDFQVSWQQHGDTVRGVVTQAQPYYRARLKVSVRGADSAAVVHFVATTGASAEFVVPVGFRANAVILDPDFEVLRWTPEYRVAAAATPRR